MTPNSRNPELNKTFSTPELYQIPLHTSSETVRQIRQLPHVPNLTTPDLRKTPLNTLSETVSNRVSKTDKTTNTYSK